VNKTIVSTKKYAVAYHGHRHDPIKIRVKSRRGKKASHHLTAEEAKALVKSIREAIRIST